MADGSGTEVSSSQQKPKQEVQTYGKLPALPVFIAVDGIRYDFNNGLRLAVPKETTKQYRVTFVDMDTNSILYSDIVKAGDYVTSVKKYFIRFKLMIHQPAGGKPLFVHEYDCKDKQVLIQFPYGALGDAIGWFSYAQRFAIKHRCKLICSMDPKIAEIFKYSYKDIQFITKDQTEKLTPYASYYMGLFFNDDRDNQPIDFRYAGNHRTASYILGVDSADIPPRVNLTAQRAIKQPYVVIATQASSQAKYWNNINGWHSVILFLIKNGYKVVCIDKQRVYGRGLVYNYMPWGVVDNTGNKTLQQRINIIKDADFFIGLSSGLSWLAWCCKIPVVMISGLTAVDNEFYTPYRIINYNVCNSCWNDTQIHFDHYDFLWCPRHKDTDRQFECTRSIAPQQVINTIKTIPAFQQHTAE